MTETRTRESARLLLATVGLGCMLAYCRAFAAGLECSLPMRGLPYMEAFSLACSAMRVAAIVLMVVLGCTSRMSPGRAMLAGLGVVMAVSGLVLAGGPGLWEGVPFAMLAGAASGVVMLAMLMFLSGLRIRDIVLSSFGGLFVGGLLIMALMRLDPVGATLVFSVSGLVAGLCFLPFGSGFHPWRADGLPSSAQLASFPWFAALAFAASGLVASVFYGAATALEWNVSGQVNYPLFGLAIVMALGATAYIALQGEEAVVAAWIPLFSLLLLAMALACFDDPEVNPSVMALLMAAVFSYHFLRWLVYPALVSFSDMPRMFICGLVLVVTSSFVGVGWGASAAASFPSGIRGQGGFVAFSAIALLVLFAAALYVTRTRLETTGMQLSSSLAEAQELRTRVEELDERLHNFEQDSPAPEAPPLEMRCRNLSEEHGLTSREEEIFLLTARGHSSTFIAEQLFISASTVRFHQQNIYRKLDVHSRQELIALANREDG